MLAVHGVGGATGTILLVFLAAVGTGGTGLAEGVTISDQLVTQIIGVVSVAIYSIIATVIIVYITKAVVGFRVRREDEIEGLDLSHHGETAYNR